VPIELDGHSVFPPIGQLTYLLTLAPFGFYWFSLSKVADWPSTHTPAPEPMPEYQTIVLRRDLADALLADRAVLEREILRPYLAKRRWFAMKDQVLRSVRIALLTRLPGTEMLLLEIETETESGSARWLLPVGIAWEDAVMPPLQSQLAMARIRRGPKVGLLTDAYAFPDFARGILSGLAERDVFAAERGVIRFEPTSRMAEIVVPPDAEMHWISVEQSNSSVIVGNVAIIKLFRRVTDGPHPEAEMGRYLTDQGYGNIPALLGEVVRVDPDGTRHAMAIAQAFVRNQGDAWTWTLELLMRGLSDIGGGDDAAAADALNHTDYAQFSGLLGRRLGEMHVVLARPSDNAAFAPVGAAADTAHAIGARVRDQLEDAYRVIGVGQDWEGAAKDDRSTMLAAHDALLDELPSLAGQVEAAILTRIHGDLHLGQVLVVNGDVTLIDFEGEPAKPVEIRRGKDHPLRDVAGVVRSFDYAAAVVKRRSPASHGHLTDERVTSFLDSFVERATDSFLTGYRNAVGSTEGQSAVGLNPSLLALFLIEKAAYEVVYESANRPTWIDVPLHGLMRQTIHLLGIKALA